ncbi:MAG TPA: RNA methyltransferase [Burkholderiales bacterium]|nr:RNA methyltransferase [Burkholderiales bacterium]
MQIDHLRQRLQSYGAKPAHEQALLRAWLEALPLEGGKQRPEDFFPLGLRNALPGIESELAAISRVRTYHTSGDESGRLLVELADGQTVETVLLPRDAICVSTQVGCAVGCVFCMTGREGLKRHLGSAEIVAQVVLARKLRTVRKVQFMGMGEPAHNLDNVLDAIELLGTLGGFAHKNLVFSTVGDLRVFERLPQAKVKPALALSLHSTKSDLRAELLPRAPRIAPEELVERGEQYARLTSYPIQYQWTLLEGINDGDDEVERIAELLAGKYAVMNFIPWNTVDGTCFRRPSAERCMTMVRMLRQRGVLATLRESAAQDVEGGCGQLRARTIPRPDPTLTAMA